MAGIYAIFRDWRHDRPIAFEKITQPVLILWARAEKLPNWMLGRLRRRLPQAEVQFIEQAGHLVLEEQPEAANRLMLRFLVPREVPVEAQETAEAPSDDPAAGLEVVS